MDEIKNILDNPDLKRNAFSVPEGYFAKMEDSVRERIKAPVHESLFLKYFKPAFGLLCSFALIFGLGYGVLTLTHTLPGDEEVSPYITLLEDEYYNRATVDYLEIAEADTLFQSSYDESAPDDEDIVTYLSSQLTSADIHYIYADLIK
ncbi:MAG: hypothetical protein PHD07_07200 [Bacteroidales bacterium]|nr:hypothetical protein [Bacteroidales bacterium]MDD3200462.1 hypothetical protein [Bacteroidales bacterium]